jgi:hypothetical protein
VLGACLVTAAAAAVWAASTARPTLASASTEGTPVHDTAPAHGTASAHGTGPSTSNNAPSTPAELSSS